jgi:hypothetical protein
MNENRNCERRSPTEVALGRDFSLPLRSTAKDNKGSNQLAENQGKLKCGAA